MELKILHFSDFHLDGNYIEDAKQMVDSVLNAIKESGQTIDLIVFTGDMLNKGGENFKDIETGFANFKEIVIEPMCQSLSLDLNRFIFVSGNHDLKREDDDDAIELFMETKTTSVEDVINTIKDSKTEIRTRRMDRFKKFEKEYYDNNMDKSHYKYSRFDSHFIVEINDIKVGISSLNTVWRAGFDDEKKIVMGLSQIIESQNFLKGCDFKIAATHYRYDKLKEFETDYLKELLAEYYDLYLTGHTHSVSISILPNGKGKGALDVNTAGALVSNEFTKHEKNKNAFQIIKINKPNGAYVYEYKQEDGVTYTLNKNKGENGESHYSIYDETKLSEINKTYLIEEEKNKQNRFSKEISPFSTIKESVQRYKPKWFDCEFIESQKTIEIKKELKDPQNNTIRFMALSGMGKTRIVFDSFKDDEEIYYCRDSECKESFELLVSKNSTRVIIVDNCPIEKANEFHQFIEDMNSSVKLITIYNVNIPKEKRIDGVVLELEYKDTEEIVDKLIQREQIADEITRMLIKERSGNIPLMALHLINAYKKNGNFEIDEKNTILPKLLNGSSRTTLDENKEKIIRSLALFEPLGYQGDVSDEFDFVSSEGDIHKIRMDQKNIDGLFKDNIDYYLGLQILEINGKCIHVRPKPLAEWLTEAWLDDYGKSFADVYKKIESLDPELSKRLINALSNRLSEMTMSTRAKQLFDKYNNPDDGFFHDERIAFSKSGSRLFLSMSLVSPVMVSKNLESLICSKTIDWLKSELDHDARRNLIWAMENIDEDAAFESVAKSLGWLALAENESFSNNATGQFLQLFHLFLSGTKANLKSRVKILHDYESIEEAQNLLLDAIDHAFKGSHFVRAASYKHSNNKDYQPAYYEIKEYWTECLNILERIMKKNSASTDSICEILEKHVYDFHELGLLSVLFEKLGTFADVKKNQWVDMRNALSRILDFDFKCTEEELKLSKEWIEKLSLKTFYARLQAFVQDERNKRNSDWNEREKNIEDGMMPFVKEFLEKEIYKTDELEKMIVDQEFSPYHFINILSQKISVEQLNSLLGEIFNLICCKDKNIEISFVYMLAGKISDKEPIIKLKDDLYNKGYFRMYSSLLGIVDQQNCDSINDVIEKAKNGIFDDTCVNNYLRRCSSTIKNVFSNFSAINDAGLNPYTIGYLYLQSYICYPNIQDLKEQNCLENYKSALLSYPFSSEYRGQSQDVIHTICDVLDGDNDADFARNVHSLVVRLVVKDNFDSTFLDHIYHCLLPKYQDAILDDLLDVLVANDNRLIFFLKMYLYLGSGFGHGKGPLFQCDENKLKKKCSSYPSVLPQRLALMCPIYEFDENSPIALSNFFLWLCDNYGNDKKMLDEFACNMGTESWTGFGGYSSYVANKKKYIEPLLKHSNETVRNWADKMCRNIDSRSHQELENEEYSRMVRG